MVTQQVATRSPARRMTIRYNERGEEEVDDQDVTLGMAINTRNYQALLNNTRFQPQNSAGRRGSYAPTSPVSNQHDNDISNNSGGGYGDVSDTTVFGLPVETNNYIAMIAGDRNLGRHSAGVTDRSYMEKNKYNNNNKENRQRNSVANDDCNSGSRGKTDGEEDDDAVMGLPISTANYKAILRGDANSEARHRRRGYSELADQRSAERRGSAIGVQNERRSAQFATEPVSDGSKKDTQRLSCFDDTRRSSSAAIVPHTGWLQIQSNTFKSWKRYYASLSGLEFKYSKGIGQAPKGFGTVKTIRQWNGLQFGLLFEFISGSQLHVRCENEDDYEQWLDVIQKALERSQHLTDQSKTSYTLTASEQHEGYLFKQEKNKAWKRTFVVFRIDGYLECRDDERGSPDSKCSGFVEAVSFADSHPNGLVIQLDSGVNLVMYAESFDDKMLWYGAMSSAASANQRGSTSSALVSAIKSTYVQTARSNHAGWVFKQTGLFKSWTRVYATLHGLEMSFAKDTNSVVFACDKVKSVEEWDGKPNGLLIHLSSGKSWKIHVETYEGAKRWRTIVANACRHDENFNVKRYLMSRKRKKLPAVYGGWLTSVTSSSKLRQFYVVDGKTLGYANDVDNQLKPIGTVVDVGASRDLDHGIVVAFSNGTKLKLAGDSLESSKAWYECLNAAL